jgi:hypothetical protein
MKLNKKFNKNIFIYLFGAALFVIYLIFVIKANIDLNSARAIHMDELITFDGIQQIYHSSSFGEFLDNVLDGKDHRYGRILWNISALTSYAPYLILGEAGQIFATRMTQAILLFLAYFILVWTFIKQPLLRIFSSAVLLLLPFTPYFVHIPKPEPIQLFALSLFFWIIVKYGLQNLWTWFLLGIALGAKVSLLPFAIFMLCIQLYSTYKKELRVKKNLFEMGKYVLCTFLGFASAVPILFSFDFEKYAQWTIINTTHEQDDAMVNIFSWLNYIINDYFSMPIIFNVLVVFVILFGILYLVKDFFKLNKKEILPWIKHPEILLTIVGASFILPNILFVKRIWGFYLHTGSVLLFIASIIGISSFLKKRKKFARYGIVAFLIAISSVYFIYQSKYVYYKYSRLANRSETEQYITKEKEYQLIKSFLEKKSKNNRDVIRVFINPFFFIVKSTENYKMVKFWGPFVSWDSGYDYVINYKDLEASYILKDLSRTNINYDEFKKSEKLQKEHVGNFCKKKPCYKKIHFPLKNVIIYEKL